MYILVIKQLVIMLLIAALSFFVSRKVKFAENEKFVDSHYESGKGKVRDDVAAIIKDGE